MLEPRERTGFGPREFALLATLPPEGAVRALRSRVDALFDTLNATPVARRIVETRRKRGARNATLFQSNSLFLGPSGHVYAVHYGGRWEPQFKMGWFASPPFPDACFAAGLGFNLAPSERDPKSREGEARALAFFERFQQALGTRWKRDVIEWMSASAGFIQLGYEPPLVDAPPADSVERLLTIRDSASIGRIFCGRWLFLDRAHDAAVLGDLSKLAKVVEETFGAWAPVWFDISL